MKEPLLLKGTKERVTLKHQNSIDTKKGVIVSYETIPISQALEKKVEEAIKELLEKKFIGPSSSAWSNKIIPVINEDISIRLTTNLIKLNQRVLLG